MKFSIVLPTYNVSKYIERALLSCLNQTYENIEIIVVDDCGIDDSIQKAEYLSKHESKIKIIKNPRNMGTFHARRIGVENASGDYILFLDPDDELKKNALHLILEDLSDNEDIILSGVENYPAKKLYQTKTIIPKLSEKTLNYKNTNRLLSIKAFNFGTAGKIFKTDILISAYKNLNVPDTLRLIFAEDLLLFSELINVSSKVCIVNEITYIYHKNNDSITQVEDQESLNMKLKQVEFCKNLILQRASDNKEKEYIYLSVANRLILAKKKLELKLSNSFYFNFNNYLFITFKTKSFKYLIKMIIYTLSIKKIKKT